MPRSKADQRVAEALRALTADKETSIRALAAALDDVEKVDAKIAALHTQRNTLLEVAQSKLDLARNAGWRPKDLVTAGLIVPRPVLIPPVTDAGDDPATGDTDGTLDPASDGDSKPARGGTDDATAAA